MPQDGSIDRSYSQRALEIDARTCAISSRKLLTKTRRGQWLKPARLLGFIEMSGLRWPLVLPRVQDGRELPREKPSLTSEYVMRTFDFPWAMTRRIELRLSESWPIARIIGLERMSMIRLVLWTSCGILKLFLNEFCLRKNRFDTINYTAKNDCLARF